MVVTPEFVVPGSANSTSAAPNETPAMVPAAVALRSAPLKWVFTLNPPLLKWLLVTPRVIGPWPVQLAFRSMVVAPELIGLKSSSRVQAVAGTPDALVLAAVR